MTRPLAASTFAASTLAASTLAASASPRASESEMARAQILDLIAARTGLAIRPKDQLAVGEAIAARARAQDVSGARYLQLLRAEAGTDGPQWRALLPALTNGESYFWRDRGQFALLGREILPALLRARPHELRIWSAGCSSGEECYSLAMLLDDLLPAQQRPRLQIVGTDVNEDSLARARRGCYGDWSFRGVDARLRDRHFTRVEQGWQISERLRAQVSFRALNLAAPTTEPRDFDLIVCRNVLIYLAPAAVAQAVASFARALRPGGFLLTGHAELAHRDLSHWVPRLWPESVIYQKPDGSPSLPPAPTSLPTTPSAILPAPITSPKVSAPPRPSAAALPLVAEPLVVAPLRADEVTWEAAQKAADAGDYDEAIALCRVQTQKAPCEARAYLLWARIEIERGERGHAKTLLKKVVYLAPEQAAGWLELAEIYAAEDDGPRAEKMRATAATLVE